MLLLYLLVSALFFCRNVGAEWVVMPEFSDETKIYRVPSGKYDQFRKFLPGDRHSHFLLHSYRNVSDVQNDETYDFPKEHWTIVDNSDLQTIQSTTMFTPIVVTTTTTHTFTADITAATTTEDYTKIKTTKSLSSYTTESTTAKIEEPTPSSNYKKPLPDSDLKDDIRRKKKYQDDTSRKAEGDFLEYLPMDVFRNVHRILKSQPTTTAEGKLDFLKSFEKTLLKEIESRLGATLIRKRKTRSLYDHHDHGYEEHDEHGMGFPSVEGALMAISFLTFAVYLVRLVMLLFRNMSNGNNGNGNGTNGAAAATVYLGRRKRSVYEINEDTARILSSVESFMSNFQ